MNDPCRAGPGRLALAGPRFQDMGQSPGLASLTPQTREDRAEAGRALRRAVPRGAHAGWTPPASRPDPVATVLAQERGRIAELLPRRHGLMAGSPLAFLRGAASVMAADLAATPAIGLRVQACGDCHLMNFGAFSSPEGAPLFDINDFDETLPAPFEWDTKRLAASLVLAGRETGLDEAGAGALAREAVRAYAGEMAALAALDPLACWSRRIDLEGAIAAIRDRGARHDAEARLRRALEAGATRYGLLEREGAGWRLRGDVAQMFRLPRHDGAVHAAFDAYRRTLQEEDRQVLLRRYRLADWAFKVVGVGSVGTFCAIGLFLSGDGAPLLLQLKQAERSVLAPFAGASDYAAEGERVVTGQRMMQAASDIFLGWARMPAAVLAAGGPGAGGTMRPGDAASAGEVPEDATPGPEHVYVRRLKDARLGAVGPRIAARSLASYAALCGRTLARAHARSGDAATLSGYVGSPGYARAVAAFARDYADQATRDWRAFTEAIAAGRVSQDPSGQDAPR